ncbi:MAG: pitrilysin family protein [Clostridiales bacterium]|nr:pitrilysin family protein [Clostridiales bacterium]
MKIKILGAWSLFLLIAVSGSVFLEGVQETKSPILSFSRYKLKNGLEVVLSENYSLPIVSVVVAFGAGSIYEEPGKTGLAYFLENMMFQGSANIGPMQHIGHINRIGGVANANTTEDITYFYQTVPSNQLALALWLESDRMRSLEINVAKVEEAKASLLDEIAQRRSTEPYLESSWAFDRLIYPDVAHSHPILGKEEDIRRLSLEDINNFYQTYYVPNNAVLCIVGSFNLARARDLVEKYFGSIPPGKELPPYEPPKPAEKKEIVQSFRELLAPSPAIHLGYRMAAPYSADFYPLTILDYILLKGKSSRLYSRIMRRDNLSLSLSGGIEKRKDVAALKIFAMVNNETMIDICQKAIFSEVQKLRTSFVLDAELQKAKNLFKRDYLRRFSTTMETALFLAEMHFSSVGLEYATGEIDKYLKVTPSEVVGAASRYLGPENSVSLIVRIR